ncbi:aspartate carbamoyltransferase regulatory subunit [Gemmiger formicilis]|uniref:aspartate carbamoyltransferase regulatory subunit n=1 Tax=Gemmiger formicilis TaxID=745368 RepID=UPI003999E0BA
MLKVDEIQNGVVIDHITAGTGLALYHMMELEKLHNASVALLQNVRSQKDGKKGHNKDRGRCQRDEL